MSSTWKQGEPIVPLNTELNQTLRSMYDQKNPANVDDEINRQLSPPVDTHNHALKSYIWETLTSLTLKGLLFYLL